MLNFQSQASGLLLSHSLANESKAAKTQKQQQIQQQFLCRFCLEIIRVYNPVDGTLNGIV